MSAPGPAAESGADALDGLHPEDGELLASLGRSNDWTRGVLCTLARRGAAVRLAEPQRTRALLAAVAPWPWYKAGQFLFDLLEWEDFMVDGPAPALEGDVDGIVLRLLAMFRRLQRELEGGTRGAATDGPGASNDGDVAGDARDPANPRVEPATNQTEAASVPGVAYGPGSAAEPPTDLPPLESSFYLYQDVVVGTLVSLAEANRARPA